MAALPNTASQVIPWAVLENAKGFAIFTLFKAEFVAGSGIVVAKLPDGCTSVSPPWTTFVNQMRTICSMVGPQCHLDCGARCGGQGERINDLPVQEQESAPTQISDSGEEQ